MNIAKTTLSKKDQAYQKLKELILSGYFSTESFLSERSLASLLTDLLPDLEGISKTPVRSAVEKLASEGFLIVSPQQGIMVKVLSHSEIRDSFEILTSLESFAVKQLAGKLTAKQIEVLEQKVTEQEECIDNYDINRAIETDLDFHISLCEFLENKEILRVVWRQRDILYRVKHQIYQKESYKKLVEKNWLAHKELLNTLEKGHGELATKLIERYIEFWKQLLLLSIPNFSELDELLSEQDFKDFFGLHLALEKDAVEQLAGKLTAQQIEMLEQKIIEQKKYINTDDNNDENLESAVETELDFHISFYEFLDNKQILNIAQKNRGIFYRIQYKVYSKSSKERVERSQLSNKELLDALKEGNGELATRLVGQYIRYTKLLFEDDSS